MNMFKKIKMNRLLNRRYKLKAELMAMEDPNYNFYDSIIYPGGMSAERSIRIDNLKKTDYEHQCTNQQTRERLSFGSSFSI